MRFHLFTRSILQFRYLVLIIIAMTVPTFIVGSCLYYFIFTIMAEQLGIPEAIAINLLPVLKKINFMLVIGLIPLFILLLLWGLILSHRFAGPIMRIERDLDRILEGNYSIRLKVRKNDDIKGIIDRLNRLLEKINGHSSHRNN